jgi:hypothetical protein
MLCSIPIYAVMVEDLGERGAHYMAYKELCKEITPVFSNHIGNGLRRDSIATERSAYIHQTDEIDDVLKHKRSLKRYQYLRNNSTFIIGGSIMIISAFLIGNISSRMRK